MTPAPRVVTAFLMPNGATRVVRDDGSLWDWWEGEQAWHLVAPPIPTGAPEPVEVADAPTPPQGCWRCDNCVGSGVAGSAFAFTANSQSRCYRCGTPRP